MIPNIWMDQKNETLHGYQDNEGRKNENTQQVGMTHILRRTDETNQELLWSLNKLDNPIVSEVTQESM